MPRNIGAVVPLQWAGWLGTVVVTVGRFTGIVVGTIVVGGVTGSVAATVGRVTGTVVGTVVVEYSAVEVVDSPLLDPLLSCVTLFRPSLHLKATVKASAQTTNKTSRRRFLCLMR
jgi:hypothetical protein